MQDDINYDDLDDGIRETVRFLRSRGFQTTDSGDGTKCGEMECAVPFPMVAIVASPVALCCEADRLAVLLSQEEPHRPWRVEASYSPGESALLVATADPEWEAKCRAIAGEETEG